jgi:hypothetical protein
MKLIACAAALALCGLGGAAMAQQQTAEPTDANATATTTTTTTVATDDPVGGYASTPVITGTPVPGQPMTIMPSPSPSEAFPPPAPLDHYPICKRGQFDNCMQRGG